MSHKLYVTVNMNPATGIEYITAMSHNKEALSEYTTRSFKISTPLKEGAKRAWIYVQYKPGAGFLKIINSVGLGRVPAGPKQASYMVRVVQ